MFLERLPWPSLQTYIALSVVLLAGSTYNAYSTLSDFRLKVSSLDEAPPVPVDDSIQHSDQDLDSEIVLSTVLWYLVNDSFYVWVSFSPCSVLYETLANALVLCHSKSFFLSPLRCLSTRLVAPSWSLPKSSNGWCSDPSESARSR